MKPNINKLLLIFFIFFIALVIYQLIRKLLGGSWGIEEIQNSAIIAIVVSLTHLAAKMSEFSASL